MILNILKKIGIFLLDMIQTVVLALSIFVIIYLFLVQPHQVKGISMFPNFHNGDYLLTDKISYRFNTPQRGDVIVFKAPPSEPCAEIECEYIKRIIGLPGDKIKVQNGYIYINGQKLKEAYLPKDLTSSNGSYLREETEQIIPPDEYLPMGDNRNQSRDGREFGPIPRSSIVGKAWLRYWPMKNSGLIEKIKY